jgi:hypothetical protein
MKPANLRILPGNDGWSSSEFALYEAGCLLRILSNTLARPACSVVKGGTTGHDQKSKKIA